MGKVLLEGEAPYQAPHVRAASARAIGKIVELEFWVGKEGESRALVVHLEPHVALALAGLIVLAAGEARGQ